MAVSQEYWQGVDGDQNRRSIRYLVSEAVDDNDALDHLELNAPATYDQMPRENITIREISKKDGMYEGTAIYTRSRGDKPAENTDQKPDQTSTDANHSTYSFEQSLSTVLVRESLYGTTVYDGSPPGPAVPDPDPPNNTARRYTGINYVRKTGRYEGVDKREPFGSFSLDWYPSKANVTRTYQKNIRAAVGKINSVVFYDEPIGSVMLVGVSGSQRNTNDWQFNARFEIRPALTDVIIGSGSNQHKFSAQGWEYFWVDYLEIPDPDPPPGNKNTVLIPQAVYVEKLYEYEDFQTVLFPVTVPTP